MPSASVSATASASCRRPTSRQPATIPPPRWPRMCTASIASLPPSSATVSTSGTCCSNTAAIKARPIFSSFPRKREPRATAPSLILDPRFRGGDEMRPPEALPFFHRDTDALAGTQRRPADRLDRLAGDDPEPKPLGQDRDRQLQLHHRQRRADAG